MTGLLPDGTEFKSVYNFKIDAAGSFNFEMILLGVFAIGALFYKLLYRRIQ